MLICYHWNHALLLCALPSSSQVFYDPGHQCLWTTSGLIPSQIVLCSEKNDHEISVNHLIDALPILSLVEWIVLSQWEHMVVTVIVVYV